jgi:hypothetical protein
METMRESWTDERLDDLKEQIVEQGRRTDLGFSQLRTEMRAEFGSLNDRFDRLQQAMIGFCGLMAAALVGLVATQL